jgi:hypothetical protein
MTNLPPGYRHLAVSNNLLHYLIFVIFKSWLSYFTVSAARYHKAVPHCVGSQRSGIRGRKSGIESQSSGVRGRVAEVGRQRLEVGDWNKVSEIRIRESAAGSRRSGFRGSAVRGWESEDGSQSTGATDPESGIGSQRFSARGWESEIGSQRLGVRGRESKDGS